MKIFNLSLRSWLGCKRAASSSVGLLNWSRNGVTNMQQMTNFPKI
jgi:hypothetical protein